MRVRGNKIMQGEMRDKTQFEQKKRMRDLEDYIDKLKKKNKKLKAEFKVSKKSNSHSTKGDIRNANNWTGEEANLSNKITEFCKDYPFPRYKFLKDGWQTYDPERDKSFCCFFGKNMANTYKNIRIVTTGMQFEDEWDRIYVPALGLKYTHMRCNLGSNI
jgi:hypothetical protein